MAPTINIPVYSDALVVLGTAGVVIPLVRYLGLNPVLGYLGAGALLGPLGLGSFIDKLPFLYWFTVVDAKNVSGIAELGVVFLLFLIGLELSYDRLLSMRRLVFGLGGSQVVITSCLLSLIIAWTGQAPSVAVILGACLALSSTAIVLEILAAHGELPTGAGRASFSILLAQDLAVIPILIFVSIIGSNTEGSLATNIGITLAHAAMAIALIVLVGRVVLRPLFRLVGSMESLELLTAAVLFVIIGTGVLAAVEGLSMALGAFVAGLLLAETEYRKAVEAIVEPFKGLLLGIFFFTVGMTIDVREIARDPLTILALVSGLIAFKAAIIIALSKAFGQSWRVAIETGFLLGPGGEFAFVAIGLAKSLGLIDPVLSSFVLAVTSLTMVLIPALSAAARQINSRMEPPKKIDATLKAAPREQHKHAIVVGHGRVGKVVTSFLKEHNIPYIATDRDAASVTEERKNGHEVYFGDATHAAFMKACGIMEAAAVIVTVGSHSNVDAIVLGVRKLRADVLIVARARDTEHARHLYAIGVTDAVPETVEASLQISEAALVGLGIPAGYVIASVHEKRDQFRAELRDAAKEDVRQRAKSKRSATQK
ncbi:cation:proton antiporter [Methylocystis sp. H62]|uniref:Potassium transporter TrkA n=1 Tax=Methylocystis rosea TaxID=173366 RepID=A0A3G8MD64_9HYPH|nr:MULTISPECIES: cation:proton antiporter [Methylocystis]AZG79052.1 potassium transporter TrkA [Methylocystis rosea]MBG0792753.1 cation:proton antiporter [Methylocystis sp. H62]MBG0797300.1 cation:proton antiporter [Methylocystis sp. L43]MBG0804675.1 cation:proton antiporter [Methylocystis sp. H15]QGM95922.1 potassium transporter TrkA [Methylocystis rosea]